MTNRGGRPATATRRLLMFYASRGAWCKLTTRETAAASGLNARQVVKARKELVAAHLIEVVPCPVADEGSGSYKRVWVRTGFDPKTFDSSTTVLTTHDHSRETGTIQSNVLGSKPLEVKDDAMDVILERKSHTPTGLRRTDDPLEEAPSVQFRTLFLSGFNRKYGVARGTHGYRWVGKDNRIAKQLTDAYGLDVLEAAVKAFFAMDGYGAPTVGNFAVRCEELMVTVQENLAIKRERDARPKEEKRAEMLAAKVQRIASAAMEVHGITKKDREWLWRHVARWTDAQRFAKHNRYIMRAALTDVEYEEHEREREERLG